MGQTVRHKVLYLSRLGPAVSRYPLFIIGLPVVYAHTVVVVVPMYGSRHTARHMDVDVCGLTRR
jgi:hypothetical protein